MNWTSRTPPRQPRRSTHPAPTGLCGARKPDTPQQGESCVFLPHAGSPGHSWEPWTVRQPYTDRGVYE